MPFRISVIDSSRECSRVRVFRKIAIPALAILRRIPYSIYFTCGEACRSISGTFSVVLVLLDKIQK